MFITMSTKSIDVIVLDIGAFQKLDPLIRLADVNSDGTMVMG